MVGGLTAAVFAGVILVVGSLLPVVGSLLPVVGSLLPVRGPGSVAVSTLAATAVFNPLRRRAQQVVDRCFSRARYNSALEVEQFSERLRDTTDVYSLTEDLIGVVRTTLQPSVTAIWIADR